MRKAVRAAEVVFDREVDGLWIAEVAGMPGALAYGKTKQGARAKAEGIAKHTGLKPGDL